MGMRGSRYPKMKSEDVSGVVYNLCSRESAAVGVENFVAAYAVSSEAFGTDIFQKSSFYICLDCIMNLYVVLLSKFRYMIYSLVEELHIIVVEWSSDLVQVFYCVNIQHNILHLVVGRAMAPLNRGKTVAKITKNSVFSQNGND